MNSREHLDHICDLLHKDETEFFKFMQTNLSTQDGSSLKIMRIT